jgi:hypothetical protein
MDYHLYDARAEDFISVRVQVNNDLKALCSALEDAWKEMCKLSMLLVVNGEYLRRSAAGESVKAPLEGKMLTSSNTAVYSASAGGAVFVGNFGISSSET